LKVENEKGLEDQAFKLNQRRAMNSEIKQYQEQKKEAENFERKAAQRDDAIVTHVLWKLFHLQQLIEQSGAEIQKHQEELKEGRRNIEKFEQQYDAAKREQAKASRECSKVERNIKQKEKSIEDKQSSLVPIDEKLAISGANVQKYQSRVSEITKEKDSQSKTVDQLQKSLGTVDKAQKHWEKEWKAQAQQQGRQLTDSQLQDYNKLRGDVTKRTAGEQIKVDNLTRQLKTDEETAKSLQSKVDSSQAQVEKSGGDLAELKERRNDLNGQLHKAQADIGGKKKELNEMTSERLRTAQKQTELEEKLQDVLHKLAEVDNGRRESDREMRAKETVAAMKRIYPGVRGRVHELCKPKQKKYETAIGIALGRHWDSIVVDTESTAKECISYLRDQRAGQGTFIPLDTISVKPVNPNLKGMHRGMRLAIDTIEFDSAVERALAFACGSSMICDDIKVAKHICYDKGVDATAVTLDGIKISKGGLMTGGRGQHDKPRQFDDGQVENLRKLKDKFLSELTQLNTSKGHRRGQEEEILQGELAGLEQQSEFLRQELKSTDRNLQDKKKELAFAKSQLAESKPKLAEQAEGVEALRSTVQIFQSSIHKVEDKVFGPFCQKHGYSTIREYEAQQGSLQQEALQKKLEFSTQKSRLENQLSFESQRLAATEDRIKRIQDQSDRDEQLISSLNSEKATLQREIDAVNEELDSLNAVLQELNDKSSERGLKAAEEKRELQKRSKGVDEILKHIAEEEATVQRSNANRYTLLRKSRIEEIKLPLAEGSEPLTSLPLNEMGGADPDDMDVDEDETSGNVEEVPDYGIEVDFDQLEEDLKGDDTPKMEERLKAAIDSLASEMDKMAPNMRATDRLEGVETRLKNTERELDTARRAAKRANDDFEEVKEKRLDLFNKAFNHISEQIGNVYKDLTRGSATPLGGQA
jgi:structural maintenance of chromosome 1